MNLIHDAIEELECLILINKVVGKKYETVNQIEKLDKTKKMNKVLKRTINKLKKIEDEPGKQDKSNKE